MTLPAVVTLKSPLASPVSTTAEPVPPASDLPAQGPSAQAPNVPADATAPATAGIKPLSARTLADTDIPKLDFTAGSFRVQVATSADCSHPLLDHVYPELKGIDLHSELAQLGSPDGIYWVRVAFVDLLDNQQPFSKAHSYKFQR